PGQAVLSVLHRATVQISTSLASSSYPIVNGDLLVEARRPAGISQAELGRQSGGTVLFDPCTATRVVVVCSYNVDSSRGGPPDKARRRNGAAVDPFWAS